MIGARRRSYFLDYGPAQVDRPGAQLLRQRSACSCARYAYIRMLGPEGCARCREIAVLNANYILARLRDAYDLPVDRDAACTSS